MSKTLTEAAKAILLKEDPTPLSATLKPGSGPMDPPQAISGEQQDLGPAPVTPMDGGNVGAVAATPIKKDTSKSSQTGAAATAAPAAPAPAVNEDTVNEEDDVEISEELAAFIEEMIAEGKSDDEISEAVAANFELIEENEEEAAPVVVEAKEQLPDLNVDLAEDVEAIFVGEDVSEEFKERARVVFETAVKRKVAEEITILEQAYTKTLEEQSEAIVNELTESVDNYLGYVVEQWTVDNAVQIESGLRSELTEDFISGFRNLCAEHYIDLPEDKVNVVEEMATEVSSLKSKLNEEIERGVALTKMLAESKKDKAIADLVEGLTDTQAAKLKSLAENVDFSTAEEFAEKLSTLKESYFPVTVKNNSNALDNEPDGVEPGKLMTESNSRMDKYVKVLGNKLPN